MALRLDAAALARAVSRPAPRLVLMYHRVDEPRHDPFGLCVSPENFRAHLSVLGRYADPAPLGGITATSGRPRVAVTFDDGYLDNLENALPALEAAETPATVFVVSDAVGAREEFWWDDLERIFRSPWSGTGDVALAACGQRAEGSVSRDDEGLRSVHGFLLGLPPAGIAIVVEQLREQLGAAAARLERRPVDVEELQALADSPLITIGAHTRRHPNLAVLDPTTQADEIDGSRQTLEALLDRPVRAFSYPYGSLGADTVACARRSGFSHAVTVSPGRVGHGADPLALPRMNVEDWDGDTFERRLRAWLETAG